ncbi:MAG: Uma2 family endonuclease [Roseiflexaceae bacterium]|nr:Uma2 family endonuclease [Roseiflexaceae bacterium]
MTTLEINPTETIDYPESDGQPMGETDLHRILMNELIFALRWFLSDIKAYIAGNLFVYYEAGNPKAVVAPDVFIVLGVEPQMRRTYKVWEEGQKLPDVVFELTSRSTRKADQEEKPALYARLGVREYFVFDPYGEYLRPQLQGYRLAGGGYKRIEAFPMYSEILNLELRVEDQTLRLYNPETGERLPTADEVVLARREAEARRFEVERRLLRLEQARLAAEVRAAEQSALAAEQSARADAAEAELARLRAERATQ